MTKVLKNREHLRRVWRGPVMVAAAFACLMGSSAQADDGIFEFDPGKWMSSQRYTDTINKRLSKSGKAEEADKGPEVTPPALAEEASPPAKLEPPRPEPPKVETERPLSKSFSYSPPPMPGVNNGFAVRVTSTNDPDAPEKPASTAPVPTPMAHPDEGEPKEITLPDNWKAPSKMAIASDDDDDKKQPLNVRMSVLPTPSAVPAPAGTPDRTPPKRALAQTKKPEKTKEQMVQEKAAYEAFENYKKQQLDAIQSDRQTLKALQDAVHSLGLAKKMDFHPENGSILFDVDDVPQPLVPRGTPVPKGR